MIFTIEKQLLGEGKHQWVAKGTKDLVRFAVDKFNDARLLNTPGGETIQLRYRPVMVERPEGTCFRSVIDIHLLHHDAQCYTKNVDEVSFELAVEELVDLGFIVIAVPEPARVVTVNTDPANFHAVHKSAIFPPPSDGFES